MAYQKTVWKDQDVENPRTYVERDNGDGTITLLDAFGTVTELGTPVNATNMNHIENGIEEVDNSAVHKTGDETITGTKTFQNTLYQSSTSASEGSYVDFIQSINGARRGTIRTRYNTDGSYEILLGSNGTDASAPEGITVKRSGSTISTSCPNPTDTTSTTSKQVANAGWVNSVGNNVVHKTGNENIDGNKTFYGLGTFRNFNAFWKTPYNIIVRSESIEDGVTPSSDQFMGIEFRDKNDVRVGWIGLATKTDGTQRFELQNQGSTSGFFAPASDADGSIVTTVNKSKAANGYVRLGNGLIVQWGTLSSGKTITYSTSFTNDSSYALVFNNSAGTDGYGRGDIVVSKSSTSATVQGLCETPIRWIAVGY